MSVYVMADGSIALEGICPIEDAEALQGLIEAAPGATVDWRACDQAHTAVIQVLLATRPPLQGPPRGDFLGAHVAAALGRTAQ
jgi:hypothetical protein